MTTAQTTDNALPEAGHTAAPQPPSWLVRTGVRSIAAALAAGAAVACLLAWVGSVVFANARIDTYVQQEQAQAQTEATLASASLNMQLGQARSVIQTLSLDHAVVTALAKFGPQVEPSKTPQPERGAQWLADPDLNPLSERLTRTVQFFGVNSLWLSNAAGDAVAEGHAEGLPPFIGTNYADRAYFKAAQQGQPGRQFAIGRSTNVYGLFLSAPVLNDGQFIGMVGVNMPVPAMGRAIAGMTAVVTDDLGVIVLTHEPSRLMQAMPDAGVNALTTEARDARYKRTQFQPAGLTTLAVDDSPTLFRLRTFSQPYVMASQATEDGSLRVYAMRTLGEPLANYRRDQLWWFGLVCLLALATALLLGLAAQYLIATQGQQAALLALNQALAREARTDALTGCANRRHFLHTLAQERDRSARHQLDLCVLSLDIDHFKRVNDTYGHAAGDEVLKHFVATINSQLRQADLLGRLGGEEFSILLPHTSAPEARLTAERIRAAVEAAPADADGTRIAITVSIGGVQWAVEHNEPLDSLLAQADHALYAAKHAGRNRVAWAAQPGPCVANPPATAA